MFVLLDVCVECLSCLSSLQCIWRARAPPERAKLRERGLRLASSPGDSATSDFRVIAGYRPQYRGRGGGVGGGISLVYIAACRLHCEHLPGCCSLTTRAKTIRTPSPLHPFNIHRCFPRGRASLCGVGARENITPWLEVSLLGRVTAPT